MLINFRGSRSAVLSAIASSLSSVSSVLLAILRALLKISLALISASVMSLEMWSALSDILLVLSEIKSALPVTKIIIFDAVLLQDIADNYLIVFYCSFVYS